jgi:hypothetical protein
MKFELVRAFQVYKEGRTGDWIWILMPINYSKEELKKNVEKYLSLNYQVKNVKP